MMRNFFKPISEQVRPCLEFATSVEEDPVTAVLQDSSDANKMMEYDSDTSNDSDSDGLADCEEDARWGDEDEHQPNADEDDSGPENQPRQKRQKHDIPILTARRTACENKQEILKGALKDIEKYIQSQKTKFVGGPRGLQSYCAQAIESYLQLVVRKNHKGIPASETVAEAFGFAKKWGGQQIKRWVRAWLDSRDLPESNRGCHVKVGSLLEDPAVKAELRTYVRSNKWAMNPEKLQEFTNHTMLPAESCKILSKCL